MKSLIAALYAAALLAYLPSAVACGEENFCDNRPDAPKTRALKPKPQKEECEENGCNNRPDAPKTRALKPKPQKECEENSCN